MKFLTFPLSRLVIKVMYRRVMSYSYEMRTVFVLGHNVLHCILLCFCYLWLLFWFLFQLWQIFPRTGTNQPQDVKDITNKGKPIFSEIIFFFLTFAVFPPLPICYNASLNFQRIFAWWLILCHSQLSFGNFSSFIFHGLGLKLCIAILIKLKNTIYDVT